MRLAGRIEKLEKAEDEGRGYPQLWITLGGRAPTADERAAIVAEVRGTGRPNRIYAFGPAQRLAAI